MNIKEKFNKLSLTERALLFEGIYKANNPSYFEDLLKSLGGYEWFNYNIDNQNFKLDKSKDIIKFLSKNYEFVCFDFVLLFKNLNKSVYSVYCGEGIVILYFKYSGGVENLKYYINDIKQEKEIEKIFKEFYIPVSKDEVYINLLYRDNRGFGLRKYEINKQDDINLELNYNDDFIEVDNKLKETILKKNKSMNVLHGIPGTGKTNYLRNLIYYLSKNSEKEVIYLPPSMSGFLSDPSFIADLEVIKNKIIIIEDAEEALIKKSERTSAVQNILNVTDGILSDILKSHWIFTFNVDIKNIDPALLRKGRLNLKYEFEPLNKTKVEKLCIKLGKTLPSNYTLADIYNSEENGASIDKKEIGFLKN